MIRRRTLTLGLIAGLLAGCRTAVPDYERHAQAPLAAAAQTYRPEAKKPTLPALTADAPEATFIRYAVLNHPQVEAAYAEWRASVAAITPARALPDPQLTFQADVWDTVMSVMPGAMFDVMAPAKRAAMGREAAAGSEVARREFVAAVTRTATAAHKAWIELAYVEASRRLYAETIHAVNEALELTNAAYVTGRGMVTLEKQTQLQTEAARHHMHHASLDDRHMAAQAQLKSALGLAPTDPDPEWPHAQLVASPLPSEAELWAHAAAANPELARMRAMVEMAVAGVEIARRGGTSDFSIGAMANVRNTEMNPRMIRPTATVTLPVWRDKIAANIAAAEARRDAATARVRAEQLDLAAMLAQALYMARESDRMLNYIDRVALPSFDRTLATLEASVQSGMGDAAMIAETRMMAIDLRHERLDALRDRENAVAELLQLTAAIAPADPAWATQ